MSEQRALPILWRLYKQGLRHRGVFVLMVLSLVALAGLNAVLVWYSRELLAVFGPAMSERDVLAQLPPEQMAAIGERMRSLGWTLLALSPVAAVVAGGSWYLSQWLANKAMEELRNRFQRHFMELDLAFHVTGGPSRGRRLSSVVLPEPLGPTRATVWPSEASRVTASTAGRSVPG